MPIFNNGSVTAAGAIVEKYVQFFPFVTVHVTRDGNGSTVTVDGTNDGVTYTPLTGGFDVTSSSGPVAYSGNTFTRRGRYHFPCPFRYVRLRCTTYVRGTVAASVDGTVDPAITVVVNASAPASAVLVGTGDSQKLNLTGFPANKTVSVKRGGVEIFSGLVGLDGTASFQISGLSNGDVLVIDVVALSTVTAVVPIVATPLLRFAATRLRFPTVTGTFPAAGTFQVQNFFFGTPDYTTTEPRFFLPNFYQLTTGAATSEIAGPNTINYEGLSIKVNGVWYSCPTAAFVMDPTVDPSGYLLDAIPGVTLPANTMIEGRIAFNGASGATMWGSVRANDLGEVSVGATSSLAAALTDNRTLTSANSVSRQFIPAYMVAKGGAGREVGIMVGDSIQAGDRENSTTGFLSPRGTQGFWQRGLDDNTQSKRVAFGTLALEGSRPADWATRANWSRKLDAVKMATTANNGVPPFTFVGSNHGNNSATIANPYSWLTGFWQTCKAEWPNIPIYHSEMLPRPTATGTDGFQSLAGQVPGTAESYNGGTNPGIRWQANDIIGKGATNGDPTAQARTEGWIAGSFAAWRAISYDTGANRDKLAIVACNTTLSAEVASGVPTLPLTDLGAVQVGDIIIVNPGNAGAYDSMVKSISGNNVTLFANTGQVYPAGTKVTACYTDRTGLHPSSRGHIKIATDSVIPWKQFMGWTNTTVDPAPLDLSNVPSTLRANIPGSDAYESGAYLAGRRKVGRTSTNALKDAATATLPTGWTRDATNKIITLTSSIPVGENVISDWLFENDWSINVLPSGGTTQNLTFTQCVFKPTRTKSFLVNHRTDANVTFINNTVGGSIADAAGSPMTFLMHPGGLGFHTYIDNAFWNMPEDHIRLSEGGGRVEGNFCFGGGQSQLADPHYDTIQVLPNTVPRTLKGPLTVRGNYFDMRRGIGHTQAVRMADIVAVDAGVTVLVENNVFVDPNFDISFSSADIGSVIRNNYFAAQPFPSYQKNGAADYGQYLSPVPSAPVIYDNYRLETGVKLTFEQNRPV